MAGHEGTAANSSGVGGKGRGLQGSPGSVDGLGFVCENAVWGLEVWWGRRPRAQAKMVSTKIRTFKL